MIRALRAVVIALGIAAGGYGVLLLFDIGGENLRALAPWLIGGVILHDAVLAPLTILLGYLGSRALGARLPSPVIIGSVVLGSLTLVAWPVLGREGARPDNSTLLDRNYVAGWGIAAALTLVGVVLAVLQQRRTTRRDADGARAGRR